MSALAASLARILTSRVAREAAQEAPALIPRQRPNVAPVEEVIPVEQVVPTEQVLPTQEAAPEVSVVVDEAVPGPILDEVVPEQVLPEEAIPEQALPEVVADAVPEQALPEVIPEQAAIDTPPIAAAIDEAQPSVVPIKAVQSEVIDTADSLAVEAGEFMSTSLDEYDTTTSWQPNFDHIDSDEQTQSLVAGLADRFVDEIDEARRGVIRDEQLYDMAKELGQKPEFLEKILSRETGQPANAETIMASRHVLHESAKSLKEMAHLVLSGEATDNVKLKFHRQWDFHNQFMAQYMGARAEVGRAMRSYGLPMGSESMKQKRMAEITETQAGRFDMLEVAAQIIAQDSHEGINTIVKAQKGGMSKGGAAIVEHFVASILSGVKTHIVNASGNALMTTIGPVETALAARMGWGVSSGDKVIKGEAMAQTFGLINGFNDALVVMWQVAKTGEPYGGISKFESAHPKAISSATFNLSGPWGWMVDALGTTIRFPLERVMGPIDGFFRAINERAKVAQLAYREANKLKDLNGLSKEEYLDTLTEMLTNVPEQMKETAVDYSMYNMMASPLGPLGRDVQKLMNKSAPFKVIIPFVRTPTNIWKMAFIERTPLGLLTKQIRDDLTSGEGRAQMARARLAFGGMMGAWMAMHAINGSITDSGPADYRARRVKMATGWRPRSFVFTDEQGNKTYQSYDRMEPLSYIIGAVADLVEINKMNQYNSYEEIDTAEAINALALVIAENTLDKTFMTGLRDFLLAFNKSPAQGSKMINWSSNLANAMLGMSGLRRDTRKAMDPYMRQTSTMIEKLKNGTPFLSESLPKALDIMGEPILYTQILNPWPSSEETPDLVLRHVGSLLESTGEPALTMPKKTIQGIKLSSKEYHDLINISRKVIKMPIGRGEEVSFRAALIMTMNSDEYQNAPTDFLRVEALKAIQTAFDGAARLHMRSPENTEYASLQALIEERRVGEANQKYGAENVKKLMNKTPGF